MERYINLKGRKFGKLTVIEKAPTRISKGRHWIPYWYCICDCQKLLPEEEREIILVQARKLREGLTTSCGCMRRTRSKKYNEYEVDGDIVRLYDSVGNIILVDTEDFDKVKSYCWKINNRGYAVSSTPMINGKRRAIIMHRLIMDCENPALYIDHINHNKFDNRKENLRVVTPAQNTYNTRPTARNKSGVRGVRFDQKLNKWEVGFTTNGKHRVVGYFKDFADAVSLRRQLEEKYYGEYRYKGE